MGKHSAPSPCERFDRDHRADHFVEVIDGYRSAGAALFLCSDKLFGDFCRSAATRDASKRDPGILIKGPLGHGLRFDQDFKDVEDVALLKVEVWKPRLKRIANNCRV